MAKGRDLNTYVFKVELEQEEDGRWSATVPALAGCFSWGHTREEALETIEENVRAWLEVLREKDIPLPEEADVVKVIPAPAITVAL
ncbi:type II toxin-antitoxin system HicB family antitoxin [Dehalococcoidia bacterium]|nr:type II toxin-antitoxin system HicB family antitoxin [Dehalococcoidia bacterium]